MRKQRLLEQIFSDDDSAFVSFTTHSYAISAILEVVGAPHFFVAEGAVIPLIVRGDVVPGEVAGQGDYVQQGSD